MSKTLDEVLAEIKAELDEQSGLLPPELREIASHLTATRWLDNYDRYFGNEGLYIYRPSRPPLSGE